MISPTPPERKNLPGTTDIEQALSNPGGPPGIPPKNRGETLGENSWKIGWTVRRFNMWISKKEIAPDCTNAANIAPHLVKSMNRDFWLTYSKKKNLFSGIRLFQREYYQTAPNQQQFMFRNSEKIIWGWSRGILWVCETGVLLGFP